MDALEVFTPATERKTVAGLVLEPDDLCKWLATIPSEFADGLLGPR